MARKKDIHANWLRLSSDQNVVSNFNQYLLAAIKSLLGGADTLPKSASAVDIIQQIVDVDRQLILVLDDVHTISNRDCFDFLQTIIDNQPTNLQIVFIGRGDARLNLSHLRGRGQVTDFGINQLRLSIEETVELLELLLRFTPTPSQNKKMYTLTEGWVTGIHFGLSSLHLHNLELDTFLDQYSGSNQLVADYFKSEILKNVSNVTRKFLLATSILEKFTADLCDMLLSGRNSVKIIEELEMMNAFLIPLDTNKRWYRYHILFKQFLYIRCSRTET